MPAYNLTISGFVRGDDLDIVRSITNIPSGQVVSKMWLTIKNRFTDTDAQAVIQKIITSAQTTGQGVISNIGASGTAAALFTLTHDDTILLRADREYFYDVQLLTDADKIYTPENGVIVALPSVTSATN